MGYSKTHKLYSVQTPPHLTEAIERYKAATGAKTSTILVAALAAYFHMDSKVTPADVGADVLRAKIELANNNETTGV